MCVCVRVYECKYLQDCWCMEFTVRLHGVSRSVGEREGVRGGESAESKRGMHFFVL